MPTPDPVPPYALIPDGTTLNDTTLNDTTLNDTTPNDTTSATAAALPPDPSDVRLVVADMDGTLLDAEGRVPDALWPLLVRMRERGIAFAPASGRQYATLRQQFERALDGMVFIAENGAFVVRDGVEVSSMPLDRPFVEEAIGRIRTHAGSGRDIGVVVCGKRSAYIERVDPPFVVQAEPYYAELAVVDDVLAPEDDVLKIAVFDFEDSAVTAQALAPLGIGHQVVVSSHHWLDLMGPSVNKGTAVRRLQQAMGIGPANTVAFGDYLNDLEMMGAVEHSYAMANAHPQIRAAARHTAPANTEQGVISVLSAMLDVTDRTSV
ncbi:Cof-type HAD-IIB family hydrolase [Raineyella sp. LH-20]|uniref:Cof-type HAD-IIB family hydrolase n=1 Tax=Raineyella sp. LH-20 TaxID=3081204 RepID=UPI00295543A3|nr:Cof-type HAD-IIB family hydrolase [Raineyella sp. LH-20]WOP19571.1 Cof-type HAD-IIB family hydrolase [Raineyella sp. LH-20]